MDPTLDYKLLSPDELAVRETLSQHGQDIDRLWAIATYGGIALVVLLVGVAVFMVFANRARRRDIERNAKMIADQEQRMSKVTIELSTTAASLRTAVDNVDSVSANLRSDVAKSAEILHSAAIGFQAIEEHYRVLVERGDIASA